MTLHAGRDWLEFPPLSTTYLIGVSSSLAEAFVGGSWEVDELVERGATALGRRWRWLRPLARRINAEFGQKARPPAWHVASFLFNDPGFRRACSKDEPIEFRGTKRLPARMFPAPGTPSSWDIPSITTTSALAERLGLTHAELDWFADLGSRCRKAKPGPLRHYDYHWIAKATGSGRLIEAPRPRLKAVQRQVLDEILEGIPPHEAVHGFRQGRSIGSYVAPHVGRPIVLKLDLKDFFPTISMPWVTGVFLTAGYPEAVAVALAGLCTSGVPADVWRLADSPAEGAEFWRMRRLYAGRHLPQGAPTSPALANLCAYRLDDRLARLSAASGAEYTRYADDLAFSGDAELARSITRFHIHACAVVAEEGFKVNAHKTRIMRQGVRQRVAGVVLNERPNVTRDDFDRLKATLHNCAKHGPEGQNRGGCADFRAHLAGRIAHVASLNPERGRKLRSVFDRIAW